MKKAAVKSYPVPPEVKFVPPELADKIVLTEKQKRKDLAYRDQMLAKLNSAARLTLDEIRLAHAVACAMNYQVEVERIVERLKAKRLKHGERAQLKNALKVTVQNLSDAFFEQGLYGDALWLLVQHKTNRDRQKYIVQVVEAIQLPDGDHCECPPENKFTERMVYDQSRARHVPLIRCLCGHLNASEKPPEDLATLNHVKAQASNKDSDQVIFGRARQLLEKQNSKVR